MDGARTSLCKFLNEKKIGHFDLRIKRVNIIALRIVFIEPLLIHTRCAAIRSKEIYRMSEVVWYTSFFMIANFAPFSIESKYLFAMAGSFSADSLFFFCSALWKKN